MENKRLEHPVLLVTINGTKTEKQPSFFKMETEQDFPNVIAELFFPSEPEIGKKKDKVTISILYGEDEHLLFTGEIYNASTHGDIRDIYMTDGFKKLCDTGFTAAYRKENASVILQDILDKAGITDTKITCPAEEIARFSTEAITCDRCITKLIMALEGHGHKGLRFFFDEKNTFRFGTEKDTGKNEGEVYEYETAKNIFRKGDGWIDVLPAPIRHLQKVKVDGETFIVSRTNMRISGRRSHILLNLREDK